MSNLVLKPFEQQLRDCLAHLYDYAFLHDQPLVRQLVPVSSGDAHRIQAFRSLIDETIESLKPASETDSQSKQSRFYTILVMRYLKQQSVQQIVNELYLGERQFYRDHNKAVHILSQAMWERVNGAQPVNAADSNISIQSEIRRIRAQSYPEQLSVRVFLQKSLDAIQPLIERFGAQCSLDVPDQAFMQSNDSGILRQAIIWIMSQLIVESLQGSRFTLGFEALGEEVAFIFQRDDWRREGKALHLSHEKQDILDNLMHAVGARIDESRGPGDCYRLCLSLPMKQHSLLIIDDNPDAIAIFRSYLTGYPYQILTASDGNLALNLAQQSSPELIILDLMLPQQDGWAVLQSLKHHPLTRHIPVLICSVLETAELAGSLGADGYLRKPPGEAEFFRVLSQLTHPA